MFFFKVLKDTSNSTIAMKYSLKHEFQDDSIVSFACYMQSIGAIQAFASRMLYQ